MGHALKRKCPMKNAIGCAQMGCFDKYITFRIYNYRTIQIDFTKWREKIEVKLYYFNIF